MKNYYVTRSNQMVFRGTREECDAWAKKQIHEWKISGAPRWPKYQVYYDTGKEPVASFD